MSLTTKFEARLSLPRIPAPRTEAEVRHRLITRMLYSLGYRVARSPYASWLEAGQFVEDKATAMDGYLRPDFVVKTSPGRLITMEVRNPKYSGRELIDYTEERWNATNKEIINRLVTVSDSKVVTISKRGVTAIRENEEVALKFLLSTLTLKG